MRSHHERIVQRLRDKYEKDLRFLALIIVGSVANGTAKENSDVDHILDAFLETPTVRACDALCDELVDFMKLREVEEGWINRFVIDTEWNWRHGRGPVEDW